MLWGAVKRAGDSEIIEVRAVRDHGEDHVRRASDGNVAETETRQGILASMATTSETQSSEFVDRLGRLEDQMHRMQSDLNARLDAVEEGRADDEAETLAAERIRSGAAERAQDGSEVLAELGIRTT